MSEASVSGAARRRGSGAVRTIRWLLGLQVAIALLLMGGDFMRVAPGLLSGGADAPAIDAPVRPGDQIRRYRPRDLPGVPATPGLPPGAPAMPVRLTWEAAEIDGAPGLLLRGAIEPGAAARFFEHLDGLAAPVETVALHSPGGSVLDALEIGRRLRAEGIDTRVGPGEACLSACPYILAGGVEREVSRAAVVGVHQHVFGQSTALPAFLAVEDIQRGQAEVMEHLDAMGVSLRLAAKAMQTPPEEIYVLVAEELEAFALATSLTE